MIYPIDWSSPVNWSLFSPFSLQLTGPGKEYAMDNIAAIVSSVGFPIAAFILLFYYMKNQMEQMRETVHQNTVAITKLTTYMEAKEGGEIDGK